MRLPMPYPRLPSRPSLLPVPAVTPSPNVVLERRVEPIDVTRRADTARRYIPGPVTFWRNGVQITEDEFNAERDRLVAERG